MACTYDSTAANCTAYHSKSPPPAPHHVDHDQVDQAVHAEVVLPAAWCAAGGERLKTDGATSSHVTSVQHTPGGGVHSNKEKSGVRFAKQVSEPSQNCA